MWQQATVAVIMGVLCPRFLLLHRQSPRPLYLGAGIAAGLASFAALIHLGYNLGFWSFYV
jgi:hypothetical protein